MYPKVEMVLELLITIGQKNGLHLDLCTVDILWALKYSGAHLNRMDFPSKSKCMLSVCI